MATTPAKVRAHLTLIQLLRKSVKVLGYPHKQDRKVTIGKSTASPGVSSVMIAGTAYGEKQYQLSMNFYKVHFSKDKGPKNKIPVKLKSGTWYMEELSAHKHPVRVFCSCPWFRFACEWYLNDDQALQPGRKPRPYTRKTTTRPSPNPNQLPAVCKHVYQMALELQKRGIIKDATLQPKWTAPKKLPKRRPGKRVITTQQKKKRRRKSK